ncbi:hypothetical protein LDENG_00286330 [Lucifuga dentata]|nr:hypothetical protein LDENG_00286330 [Lucifuga dentata]
MGPVAQWITRLTTDQKILATSRTFDLYESLKLIRKETRLISREERRHYRNLYKQHENSSFTRLNQP